MRCWFSRSAALPLCFYSNIIKKIFSLLERREEIEVFPNVKESQARGKSSLCQLSFTTIAEGVLDKAKKMHAAFLQPAAKAKYLCDIPRRTVFSSLYNQKWTKLVLNLVSHFAFSLANIQGRTWSLCLFL